MKNKYIGTMLISKTGITTCKSFIYISSKYSLDLGDGMVWLDTIDNNTPEYYSNHFEIIN